MRLSPLPPAALDPRQAAFHRASEDFAAKSFEGFTFRRDDGALLGPWSVWIRHPEIGEAAQALVAAIARLKALTPRIREIVILAFGARFNAAYELYAHCEVARRAGLSERQIAALCAGARPTDLDDAETLAFDCAMALARGGKLPGFLYAAAETALGKEGLAQLVHLGGAYAYVCVVLNAYDVPAPAGDARQG